MTKHRVTGREEDVRSAKNRPATSDQTGFRRELAKSVVPGVHEEGSGVAELQRHAHDDDIIVRFPQTRNRKKMEMPTRETSKEGLRRVVPARPGTTNLISSIVGRCVTVTHIMDFSNLNGAIGN